jgi:hypothetical protein
MFRTSATLPAATVVDRHIRANGANSLRAGPGATGPGRALIGSALREIGRRRAAAGALSDLR